MASKFKSSVEIDGYLSVSSGNWIQVPDGTTAQRPGSPAVGMFRYNTTTAEFEGYFGSTPAWGAIGGGGGTVTEAFKTFAVSGQSDIVADGPTDTLTVAAGNNISLTTDAATDTLTIASTGGSGGGTVTIQRNNYTGDGSTVAYGVSSTVVSENNIQIYLDGVYQDKDTFTATGVTVTFGTAPPTGTEIEIMHYVAVDGVIEVDEFVGDGTTTNFSTSLSIINEDATTVFVSGVYQSKLTYQTTGNVVSFTTAPPNGANIEIVHVKALALSGFNKNNFVGTGSQTAFTLNTTVNEENMTFVFLEGIYQDKSTYSISGSTLTFATAPQNGYNIEVMVLGAISASTNALYTDTFTGDGSQTAYALGITPVDLNAIEVYLNGLYQNVSTLTLSANTVTFATAPPSGVIIEIRSVGFLNSGGTLSPATLIGGTGIDVTTNSPNNFTIANTLNGAIDWDTNIKTANFTAVAGKGYFVNTTSAAITVTLPSSPTASDEINLVDYAGTADTNNITITSSDNINGASSDVLINYERGGVSIVYVDATQGWIAYNAANETATALAPDTILVDYLVVAGGGGGGGDLSGGGGAGGLLTNYGSTPVSLSTSVNYAVTVGAGGGGGVAGPTRNIESTRGSDGFSSTFNTITNTGGGGGGVYGDASSSLTNGRAGGSGGGAGSKSSSEASGGSGTSGQGNDGGTGFDNPYAGGGGGGAGAAGGNAASGSSAGVGGVGLAVNIISTSNATTASVGEVSGSDVYFSGGGGGSDYESNNTGTGGSGGLGGGGTGGFGSLNPNGIGGNADPNTGGGGGGGSWNGQPTTGGSGGSGVVILRYPSAYTITVGSGITEASGSPFTESTEKVSVFTAGTGNISFS